MELVKGCPLQECNYQLIKCKENCSINNNDDQNRAQEAQKLISHRQVVHHVQVRPTVGTEVEEKECYKAVPDVTQKCGEDARNAGKDIANISAAATGQRSEHEADCEKQDADEDCVVAVVKNDVFHDESPFFLK